MGFSPPLLIWYLLTILVSIFGMKLASLRAARFDGDRTGFLFRSPVFSIVSWNKRVPADPGLVSRAWHKALLLFPPFAASWWLYLRLVPRMHPSVLGQCYLAIAPLYFFGQWMSSVIEVAYLPTGWLYPAHFQFPPLSRNLSEFWGRRWASFVADWLRQMVFNRYRRRPGFSLFLAFLISGLWHEVIINVPLYLFFKVNLMGSMVIYFLFQALALWAERKIPSKYSLFHRVYTWVAVIVPAPLIINEAILRTFGLFNQ